MVIRVPGFWFGFDYRQLGSLLGCGGRGIRGGVDDSTSGPSSLLRIRLRLGTAKAGCESVRSYIARLRSQLGHCRRNHQLIQLMVNTVIVEFLAVGNRHVLRSVIGMVDQTFQASLG